LKIESVDWLLNFIIDLISHDCKFAVLLDYIGSQYLSVESISLFGQTMNFCVWSSLRRRLILSVSPLAANPRVRVPSIFLDRSRPFDGIFLALWKSCGQNPHLGGLIAISSADEGTDRKFECHDLISEVSKAGKYWRTGKSPIDQYLNGYRLWPSGYSVKVHNSSVDTL
jgi:hypothetical protein